MRECRTLDLAKPILRTWSSESHFESILLLQNGAMEWLFDSYVNLLGYLNYHTQAGQLSFIPRVIPSTSNMSLSTWVRCPFLDFHYVSHNYVRNKFKDILEYIMYAIEEDYYIYLNMFQRDLSIRMGTDIHKTFVYGYDRNKRILYVADHYDHGKYALAELGFDEFLKAYELTYWTSESCKLINKDVDFIWEKEVIVIAKSKAFEYGFNREWFKLQLQDYLDATYRLHCVAAIEEGEGYETYFGINNYDLAMDYLDMLMQNEREAAKDWRIFTLICDHKKLYKMRVDFFRERGICSISDEEMVKYDKVLKSSEIVLNLFLKYIKSGKVESLKKMKEILKSMKNLEFELLRELRDKL